MIENRDRIGGKHKDTDDLLLKASTLTHIGQKRACGSPAGRNLRSVWAIPEDELEQFRQWKQAQEPSVTNVWAIGTKGTKLAHYACFPPALVEPMVLAGSSERGACPECGAAWVRVVEKSRTFESGSGKAGNLPVGKHGPDLQGGGETLDVRRGPTVHVTTTGWRPTCAHYPLTDVWVEYPRKQEDETDDHYQERIAPVRALRAELLALWEPETTVPCVVLDCFSGTATVGEVCQKHGRSFVGIDLKLDYVKLGRERLGLDKLAAWGERAAEGMGETVTELPLFAAVGMTDNTIERSNADAHAQ